MGLSIFHKHVVMLLQEEVGVPVKARVLVDCLTHLPSVRVAITNIAVFRTLERADRHVQTENCRHPAPERPWWVHQLVRRILITLRFYYAAPERRCLEYCTFNPA